MGYMRNQCLIVSSSNKEHAKLARDHLLELCPKHQTDYPLSFDRLVTPLMPHMANGGACFMFGVDGSKEGWETSDQWDAIRDAFIAYTKTNAIYLDWAVVVLGGDDGNYAIASCPEEKTT